MYLLIKQFYHWFDNWLYYSIQHPYIDPYILDYCPTIINTTNTCELVVTYPWLLAITTIIIICLVIPVLLFSSLYLSTLALYVYRHRQQIVISTVDGKSADKSPGQWLLTVLLMLWDAHGYYWHGYQVIGWDRIPRTGPALLVYYHGCLPLDHMYLMTKVLLGKHRVIHAVGDYFLFMIPGSRLVLSRLRILTGPPGECVRLLNAGHLLSIAPGGCREALFGDNRYRLLWNNRQGFARVAREARVPIIPVFTVNIGESFRSVKWCQWLLRPLYEWSRLPLVPFYGGFPVKLTTYVGEPIPYDPGVSVDQLALRTKQAVERLIRENQRIPGNIWDAICDRF